MKMSPNFDLAEFTVSQTAARLGLDNTPPPDVLTNLQRTAEWLEVVREMLGVPIIISSGYRGQKLNRAIGSKPTSQHTTGHAVDFTAPGFGSPREVIDKIMASGVDYDQLILEFPPDGWVHASVVASGSRKQALHIDRNGTRPLSV